jgi:hypothetical protein
MSTSSRKLLPALVGAMALLAVQAASAQILILSSDDETVKANTELGADKRLKVQDGKTVRVLLPSTRTRVIEGPADMSVKDLVDGKPSTDLWQHIKSRLYSLIAGSDTSSAAATRSLGVNRGELRAKALLSWTTVPIPVNGQTICIQKGARVSFSRLGALPRNQSAPMLKLYDNPGGEPAILTWKLQDNEAAWPETLSVKSGVRYQIVPNFTQPASFTIAFIEPSETSRIDALYSKGCTEQADALLDAIAKQPKQSKSAKR